MANSSSGPPPMPLPSGLQVNFDLHTDHADPSRFLGWRPRAVATVLLFSSDAFCLECLRSKHLDGAAIAAQMNIVSAAADDGRIHRLTRAALTSLGPDGVDYF